MAEEKKKTTKKAATAKKAAPKKAEAKKVETKKTVAKKASTTKKPVAKKTSGNVVTITQTGSPIGRKPYQRATLIGLGLNKMHKTSTLEDTPAVRGMIDRVKHLLRVEDAA